jgi:hypothetical protein
MSNYTILERNTLDGFEHEDTKALYLRGSQKNEGRAFDMAWKWEHRLRPFFTGSRPYLENIVDQIKNGWVDKGEAIPDYFNPKAVDDVIDYMRERHFRSYFPNQ